MHSGMRAAALAAMLPVLAVAQTRPNDVTQKPTNSVRIERLGTLEFPWGIAFLPDGRLLIIELILPPQGASSLEAVMLDVTMLVRLGGRERTEAEYRDMYAKAGFKLERIVPTPTEVSVIEGRPV